jgi:fimbrial isopeptide formation D2 family protein/LPXTG-motif cell wall-anchored protein
MKHVKKLLVLVLAAAMAVSMAGVAFAESPETNYTITVKNARAGHTYQAYQIFTGKLDQAGDTLSNITWGSAVTDAGKTALLQKSTYATALPDLAAQITDGDSFGSAAALAKAVSKAVESNSDNSTAFAKILGQYLGSATAETSTFNSDNSTYAISSLVAGYYLVQDKPTSLNGVENEAYTSYITEVVKDKEVTAKGTIPTLTKKVQDNGETDWQDTADYDINDEVPFQLTATMPDDLTGYKSYKLVFHDTLSNGLSLKSGFAASDITVKVDGTQLATSAYTVAIDGQNLKITLGNVLDKTAMGVEVNESSEITAEYKATLNENAVLGGDGNPNEAYLEYSNNPNTTKDSTADDAPTGNTPKDKVVVFTYQVVINKLDGDNANAPLTGADFTLYKLTGDNEASEDSWTVVGGDGQVAIKSVSNAANGTENAIFTFKGLDDGKYKLVESTTPDGYNTIDPITFTITATHTQDDAVTDPLKLTELKCEGGLPSDADPALGSVAAFTVTASTGTISTDVVNLQGATLPSTGGMGTTIFYILGGIFVIGAGVLLVSRKRMSQI